MTAETIIFITNFVLMMIGSEDSMRGGAARARFRLIGGGVTMSDEEFQRYSARFVGSIHRYYAFGAAMNCVLYYNCRLEYAPAILTMLILVDVIVDDAFARRAEKLVEKTAHRN